jgi:hypothetical protein
MVSLHKLSILASGLALSGVFAYGQSIISAKSGMVHYTEGQVLLAGKEIAPKNSEFPEVKEGQTLATTEGRSEVILNPGVLLRLAENSSIKMISSRLIDTRFELLTGSALLEIAEMPKDNALTVIYKDATVEFPKKGLFRIDSSTGLMRVYDGEAVVVSGGQTTTLKEGRQALLTGVVSPEKFDNKQGDAFYRWASRRSESLAVANIAAAKSYRDSGASTVGTGTWAFNPYMGMFTYMPMNGYYNSPFGYAYYSPRTVGVIYEIARPVYWNLGGGGGMANPGIMAGRADNGISQGSMTSRASGDFRSAAPTANANANGGVVSAAPRSVSSGGGPGPVGGRGR